MELRLLQTDIVKQNSNGGHCGHPTGLYVDMETGVEYFIMNSGAAGAICPRLDRDGKPVTYGKYPS